MDPSCDLRGRYTTMDEFYALTGTRSLALGMARGLRLNGFKLAKPSIGDVAVIKSKSGVMCGAIMVPKGFVMLAEGGITRRTFDEVRVVAGWTRDAS